MNFSITFFLNSGLFDFDLTFLGEALFFLLFSLVVTFVFLSPISKQLDDRAEFIDFNLRKSNFLLSFASTKLANCVELLIQEVTELTREVKLIKNYTNTQFEQEVSFVQQENAKLLKKLKGELSMKSASLFSSIRKELSILTETFFVKKFQSIS